MTPSKARMRKCHYGKKSYDTLQQAQGAIVGMIKRKEKQGNPVVTFLRAYGCACGKFHIGNTREIDWTKVK